MNEDDIIRLDKEMKSYVIINGGGAKVGEWFYDWESESTEKKVKNEITNKQKKMIKEEIKICMNDQLKQSVEKEAGKLLKDIEKLKEEKKRLGIAISQLKQEVKKAKKEIQAEIVSMEDMIETHTQRVLRFNMLDL